MTVEASLSSSRAVVGKKVVVTAEARPANRVASVTLLWRSPEGWKALKPLQRSGRSWTGTVPTRRYGTFLYRVRAMTGGGATATTTNKRLRVVPPYKPAGRSKTHSFVDRSKPRWNPCAVIGYRVNDRLARNGALQDTKRALREIYRATGLRYRYRGKTRIVPQDGTEKYPADTQLVVAWARPNQSRALRSSGGAMGVGGARWTYRPDGRGGTTDPRIFQGYVVIDANRQGSTPAGFGRGTTRGELLMHEVAHTVGLSHVDDTRQLMHPFMQPGPARWGAGDLAGLAKLGADRGCLE